MKQIINPDLAKRPPMGWNSWDCFGPNVNEEEVKENAYFMATHLKEFGWEFVVVDLGWYAPDADKDTYKAPNIPMNIDEFGRLIPTENRFPSSAGGRGFKPLADYIHGLGLKFGIHIMRGIPWIAAETNTPILGSRERAGDIANKDDMCLWYNSMYGINTLRAGGQAYYDSLLKLYESWEVDFIKADDMGFWDGDGLISPYRVDEVEALSLAMSKVKRPMVLSLSPGAAYLGDANHLSRHAHMWRISCDFWDDWEALKRQFPRCAAWAMRKKTGHWPDADMLPLGKIGIRGEIGKARQTNFTEEEQYTLINLWCIFQSPLMFGGHFPESDELAIKLITDSEVLAVNQAGVNSREVYNREDLVIWAADSRENGQKYLAVFNLSDRAQSVRLLASELQLEGAFQVKDLWNKNAYKVGGEFSWELAAHASLLLALTSIS